MGLPSGNVGSASENKVQAFALRNSCTNTSKHAEACQEWHSTCYSSPVCDAYSPQNQISAYKHTSSSCSCLILLLLQAFKADGLHAGARGKVFLWIWEKCLFLEGRRRDAGVVCLSKIKVCPQLLSCWLPVFGVYIGPDMGREVKLFSGTLITPQAPFFTPAKRGSTTPSWPHTSQHTHGGTYKTAARPHRMELLL